MIIDPPIDKLIKKIEGGKFATVCLVSKRAHYLQEKQMDKLEYNGEDPISAAAKEIYKGNVVVQKQNL